MNAKLISKTGKTKSEYQLPEVFDIKPNDDILSLYVKIYQSNQRESNAHTKTRGEVSGSTRKLYKQKGTSNARRGSLRSPIMKGGGVVFGPRNDRNYKRSLPKALRKLALFTAFAHKANDNAFYVFDQKDISSFNTTKKAYEYVKNADLPNKVLLVNDSVISELIKSFSNIKSVKTTIISELNAYDILNAKALVISTEAIEKCNELWGKK
jgi:large subunit ribosomal protein L4